MQKLLSDNRKLAILLGAVFAVIIAACAVTALLSGVNNPLPDPSTSSQSSEPGIAPPDPGVSQPDSQDQPQSQPDTPPITEPVTHNYPDEMRAVYLIPGENFFAKDTNTSDTVKSELDEVMNKAAEMSMNTVVIFLNNQKGVIYKSTTLPLLGDFVDAAQYAIDGARARGMYIYFVWDVMAVYDGHSIIKAPAFNAALVNGIRSELKAFVTAYSPDGIFFDNYETPDADASYGAYLSYGGGIGYQNYVDMISEAVVRTASETVRAYNPGIQVGLLAGPQWAAKQEKEDGSATTDPFSSLTDGHCDVKAFIDDGIVDMVAVEAFGSITDGKIPFKTVVKWWAELCAKNDVRMYAVQASDRIVSGYTGWKAPDQITQQVIAAREIEGYCGSIFNSFSRLEQNPGEAMSRLVQYYNNELDAKYILTELTITKPTSTTYSTYETTVTIMGASDATQSLQLDGKEVTRDSSGYFSVNMDLEAGVNTFTFTHKNKTVTFKITRIVQVFQSVAPTGALTVDGGMEVTLMAYAYENSRVTAKIGGSVVTLERSDDGDDETVADSSYKKYVGTYTVPAATASVQNLGNITFNATWNGISAEPQKGASVSVNKAVAETVPPAQGDTGVTVGSGSAVVVTADQAETFPITTLNDTSSKYCYPLPKGALDYVVGDAIIYQSGSVTYKYYKLASGQRVYAGDISSTSSKAAKIKITGMTIDSQTSSKYTYVILPMTQNASYKVNYNSTGISFTFNYISEVPGSLTDIASRNAMFKSATWSGTTLTLTFCTSNGMTGYKAYYENGKLMLRFNNPSSGLSSARIFIDPGHGGTDPGALGFYPSSPEKVINLAIAKKVTSILNSKGAEVMMVDTSGSGKITVQSRLAMAQSYAPQVYICIHCNSATTSSAKGNETYYFYDFSKQLATLINNNLYAVMGNANRGVKFGYFYVNRTSQFASILAEVGFVSNEAEYKRLLNDSVQTNIANGIVSAVGSFLGNMYSGSYTPGLISVGDAATIKVTGVTLDKTAAELAIGGTLELKATVAPETATNKKITWTTSDAAKATVDENGKVTGVAEGVVNITATSEDGGFKAQCAVTVKKVPLTSIALNKTALELGIGASETLTVAFTPENVTDKTITWVSDKPEIAVVDAAGKVTGVAAGTAKITARNADGTIKAECAVTVKPMPATGVTLDKTALALTAGGTETLTATLAPANVSNKAVTWTTSAPEVATVDETGKVTAVAAGTAVITVKTADGGFEAKCTVTVTPAVVKATGVTLDKSTITLMEGKTDKLMATVLPESASNKAVTWTSSDTTKAMVDAEGNISAVAAGTAVITASADDGGFTATCQVTVTAAPIAVASVNAVGETVLSLKVGNTADLVAEVIPTDATNRAVSWTSSDGTKVGVDAAGRITAIAPTEAAVTITVTTADGGFTAAWTVTVSGADSVEP